jgi:hypothetical protein
MSGVRREAWGLRHVARRRSLFLKPQASSLKPQTSNLEPPERAAS